MSIVTDLETYLDEAGGAVFWGNQQVYNALNEGQIKVWTDTRFDLVESDFTVNLGDDIVAFNTTAIMVPQYFIKVPDGDTNTNELVKYFPTTMAKLEQFQRNWRNDADKEPSQPRWFAVWDMSHFRIYPHPDKTYTFQLWGINWPQTEISTGTTDITAPEMIKRAVMYRAAERLFTYTRPDLAKQSGDLAVEVQQLWRRQFRNRQSHNITRLKPTVDRRMDQLMKAGGGVIKVGRGFS